MEADQRGLYGGAYRAGGRSGQQQHGRKQQQPRAGSTSKRLRDIRRLLAKDDLPATVRVAQERMLEALQVQHKREQKAQQERKLAKKYHMVKFFERRKLMRKENSVSRRLAEAGDASERETLQAELTEIRNKIAYITNFPHDKKYISILKSDSEVGEYSARARRELMEQILSGEAGHAHDDAGSRAIASAAGQGGGSTDKRRPKRVADSAAKDTAPAALLDDDLFVFDTTATGKVGGDEDDGDGHSTGAKKEKKKKKEKKTDSSKSGKGGKGAVKAAGRADAAVRADAADKGSRKRTASDSAGQAKRKRRERE